VTHRINWLARPDAHNYSAARSYLSLIYDSPTTVRLVRKLRAAPMSSFMSRDIFRASGLSFRGVSNSRLKSDQKRIRGGKKLAPLLLVRDTANGKVVIADGYHRLCAVFTYDEDADIPCKIV